MANTSYRIVDLGRLVDPATSTTWTSPHVARSETRKKERLRLRVQAQVKQVNATHAKRFNAPRRGGGQRNILRPSSASGKLQSPTRFSRIAQRLPKQPSPSHAQDSASPTSVRSATSFLGAVGLGGVFSTSKPKPATKPKRHVPLVPTWRVQQRKQEESRTTSRHSTSAAAKKSSWWARKVPVRPAPVATSATAGGTADGPTPDAAVTTADVHRVHCLKYRPYEMRKELLAANTQRVCGVHGLPTLVLLASSSGCCEQKRLPSPFMKHSPGVVKRASRPHTAMRARRERGSRESGRVPASRRPGSAPACRSGNHGAAAGGHHVPVSTVDADTTDETCVPPTPEEQALNKIRSAQLAAIGR